MDFFWFLMRVAALALVIVPFVIWAAHAIVDHYFDRKLKFFTQAFNQVLTGVNTGLQSVVSSMTKK